MISWRRVWGVILRHLYNFRHNYDRMTDAFYWPVLDVIVFGFLIVAIDQAGQIPQGYVEAILFAVILWFVVWRGQNEISVNFLEELWNENLGSLLSTPLMISEWFIALYILSFVKIIIIIVVAGVVSYALYTVNILTIGIVLLPFVALLMVFGWIIGTFFVSLFLRFGTAVQTLAWAGGVIVLPLSAVYFPASVFPGSVQRIVLLLPSSYVFEAMRIVLAGGAIPWGMLWKSLLLLIVYGVIVMWFFVRSFIKAKENGISQLK